MLHLILRTLRNLIAKNVVERCIQNTIRTYLDTNLESVIDNKMIYLNKKSSGAVFSGGFLTVNFVEINADLLKIFCISFDKVTTWC